MNDRQLLELAAKAVDYEIIEVGGLTMRRVALGVASPWNPLENDAQAFRLAVALHMRVECMVGQSAARTFDGHFGGACDYPERKDDGFDRPFARDEMAATRRAIVMCAAGIGEDRLEKCPYCGARVETPCDETPPDTCEKALEATYG